MDDGRILQSVHGINKSAYITIFIGIIEGFDISFGSTDVMLQDEVSFLVYSCICWGGRIFEIIRTLIQFNFGIFFPICGLIKIKWMFRCGPYGVYGHIFYDNISILLL